MATLKEIWCDGELIRRESWPENQFVKCGKETETGKVYILDALAADWVKYESDKVKRYIESRRCVLRKVEGNYYIYKEQMEYPCFEDVDKPKSITTARLICDALDAIAGES